MSRQRQDEGLGCAVVTGLFVLALVVAAAVSLAAAVDPFGWLPSLTEVWADCEDQPFSEDDCSLGAGYDGLVARRGERGVLADYGVCAAVVRGLGR